MAFPKEYLDLVLVSGGLLIMFAYNLFHLYKYHKHPKTTELGFENEKKKKKEKDVKNTIVTSATNVIGYNITTATQLAIISLTLRTLIGAWTTYSSKSLFHTEFIYGDTTQSTICIKSIGLLICFLLAFSCFVQSVKHLVLANYLISTPVNGDEDNVKDHVKDHGDVVKEVKKAGEFWLLGLRALYFALNLLLWFFGPIPMFVSSIIMVIILFCHDTKFAS
ncbi:hypothetical protein FCV25MIE_32681 [Fagus crenata]